MTLSGTVKGLVVWNGIEIEYNAIVYGNYWEDPGDRWTPPSCDSEGPFLDEIDEVIIYDMENWCEWYDKHSDEIDALIEEDVEKNKDWDDCEWDYDSGDAPYDDPPEEGGNYHYDQDREDD